MVETAPGRYEGEFTMGRFGSFLLRAVHRSGVGGPVVAESTGAVAVSYSREYLALPVDEGVLARVAAATGGREGTAGLFDAGGQKVWFHRELWPWALWMAALLLLMDVAVRRVRMGR
jgi:hypothetical protein